MTDQQREAFPHCQIGSLTFAEWKEYAKQDDCLKGMVPSDLRQILEFAEKMQNCAQFWRDEISEDKRESNKLRAELAALHASVQGDVVGLRLSVAAHALIGYTESLSVGLGITPGYIDRLHNHYIRNLREALSAIPKQASEWMPDTRFALNLALPLVRTPALDVVMAGPQNISREQAASIIESALLRFTEDYGSPSDMHEADKILGNIGCMKEQA